MFLFRLTPVFDIEALTETIFCAQKQERIDLGPQGNRVYSLRHGNFT